MSLWSRVENVFRGDRLNREIDEELASHIEEAIEQGRDPAETRKAFGSALRQREASRDVRLIPWLDSLRADAVFGWRQLMKKKVTSAAAILSLAFAIGACTSAFRLIDALLWRPLPIAAPERLYVAVHRGIDIDGVVRTNDGWTYPIFRQMRAAVKDQAELIAMSYAARKDLSYGSDRRQKRHTCNMSPVGCFVHSDFGPLLGAYSREVTISNREVIPLPSFPMTTGRAVSDGIRMCLDGHFALAIIYTQSWASLERASQALSRA